MKKKVSDQEEEIVIQRGSSAPDGKWGWLVVFCSFNCNMIVDGVQYTFSNFLQPIAESEHSTVTYVSLIGSLLSGFYNFSGPIAGALGNKFGFRMVTITGSLMSAAGLMISYFAPNVFFLYFFYGIIGGLGFGMIYMASVITTSLYFEKYRALAASVSVCGTGVGTFVFSPLGNYLVAFHGWRLALVVEGVIILTCILFGWSFKPIEIITVVPISKSPSEISAEYSGQARHGSIYYPPDMNRNLTNDAYPTFKEALMVQDDRRSTVASLALPKSQRTSTFESMGNVRQIPIFSVVPSQSSKEEKQNKCTKCCRVCCFNFWHCRCQKKALNLGDRPMYRDDIFYEGSLTQLSKYSSSEGINYHLSVTRIPAAEEIHQHMRQKCCVCHHAVLRTCVTMTGLNLLKSKVFAFLCVSSFMYTMALYIPYVFIRKLAVEYRVPDEISVWLVAAIGISNTAGRLASGIIKSVVKVNAALFVLVCLAISGIFSFVFLFSTALGVLFSFACIFGFFTAPFVSLRPVIIVEFLGLEKLTNAFGLVLLSQGVASILGPPVAGALEERTGNCVYVIYLSGSLMLASASSLLVSTLLTFKTKDDDDDEDDEVNETTTKADQSEEVKSGKSTPRSKEEQDEENYAIIPPNGGWGWLVVVCAFYCNVVVDGIQLTFGVFLKSISETFKADYSEVALAGSLMFGVHLLMGPVCAGFSNVFGLRPVTITGSLICCFGVGITYFANGAWYLYFSYGIVGGMGLGLVYMNSLIITSVYFTSLMPIAIAIVVCGTGVGTVVFAILGNFLLTVTTWQNSFLMQAALAGSMGLAAISFRPLKPVKVKVAGEHSDEEKSVKSENTRPSTRRGSVFIKKDQMVRGIESQESLISLRSVPNIIWSGFLQDAVLTEIQHKRRCSCSDCCRKKRKDSEKVIVLSEVKDDNSKDRQKNYVEKPLPTRSSDPEDPKTGPRFRSTQSHVTVFQRREIPEKPKYKTCDPLKRTVISMMDCHLLGSCAFTLFTISGALQMASLLIVFIYEKERCKSLGFTDQMSVYFVITLGGSNMFWRLLLGGLAIIPEVNYRALSVCGIVIGGIATLCSGLSTSVYWQFAFCVFFGLGMASFAVFRLVLLVELVEPEFVGNATGINLLFMGVLCVISPPIFGKAMEVTNNYNVIFFSTGILMIMSGFMQIGLNKLRQKELKKINRL